MDNVEVGFLSAHLLKNTLHKVTHRWLLAHVPKSREGPLTLGKRRGDLSKIVTGDVRIGDRARDIRLRLHSQGEAKWSEGHPLSWQEVEIGKLLPQGCFQSCLPQFPTALPK
jgi:hypothetical protein